MKAWLSRLLYVLLGPPRSDVLEPSKRVAPDPQHAAELAKRFSELSYTPETGFHRDTEYARPQNVVPFRRRQA